MQPIIQLRKGATARVKQGHPWVFGNDLAQLPNPEWDGEVVACKDERGRHLGYGISNHASQIVWRKIANEPCQLNEDFFRARVTAAVDRRKGNSLERLIWSESDDLPGLIVDRYGDVLVLQCLTLAMDRHVDLIADLLIEVTGVGVIVARNDAPVRKKEGLACEVNVIRGQCPESTWLMLNGLELSVDLLGGQKTGLYLDQRDQYALVASYAKGRNVLDACCHQGGFALHCKQAEAASVTGVDSSEHALEQAKQNAMRNNLKIDWVEMNIFDFFRQREHATLWDLIILDPPPFAPSKAKLESALRGYRELNLQAIKGLRNGGLLATYTCSHIMTYDLFRKVLVEAAADAGRQLRLREICRQPEDHPVLMNIPESEYLRGFLVEVTS